MSAKELMRAVRPTRNELELLRQQEDLMASLKAVSYDGAKVQTSPEDRMPDTVDAIQRLGRLIQSKADDLARLSLEAMEMIYSLDNPEYRRILILYYIDGNIQKSWSEVAHQMGYSESRAKHIHGWALQEIENKRQHEKAHKSTKEHFEM
nr:hypothetical protein [uncultured Acetatifactor sp.]